MDVASRVIRGDYGNGEERKRRLADEGYNYYALTHDEVNRRLGYSKRHDPFDYW